MFTRTAGLARHTKRKKWWIKKKKNHCNQLKWNVDSALTEKKNACDQNADTFGTIFHVRPFQFFLSFVIYYNSLSIYYYYFCQYFIYLFLLYSLHRLPVCKRQNNVAPIVYSFQVNTYIWFSLNFLPRLSEMPRSNIATPSKLKMDENSDDECAQCTMTKDIDRCWFNQRADSMCIVKYLAPRLLHQLIHKFESRT